MRFRKMNDAMAGALPPISVATRVALSITGCRWCWVFSYPQEGMSATTLGDRDH
jgi:hypothetical protein